MTGVLDLTDAREKLDRAKELQDELVTALCAWVDSGGVEAQSRRSHQFVCYKGFAKVNTAPPINLPLRAGEILHALRTALDYTAFQIYLAGGGTPDGDDAHKVEFPIVDDPAKWEGVVKRKVPGAWPAAIKELRSVQQFKPSPANPPSPLPPISPLLTRLRILGGTDKHRNLSMFATGAWSASHDRTRNRAVVHDRHSHLHTRSVAACRAREKGCGVPGIGPPRRSGQPSGRHLPLGLGYPT